VYEREYKEGRREGRGVYLYAAGDVYEGEYRQGRMEGRGIYRLADGSAEVGQYKGGTDVGEGARWSPDRQHAWRLKNGKVVEEISVEEAAHIAGSLGLPVPKPVLTGSQAGEGVGSFFRSSPQGQQQMQQQKLQLELAEQMGSMSIGAAPQVPVAG
jgi:hypothetical protein